MASFLGFGRTASKLKKSKQQKPFDSPRSLDDNDDTANATIAVGPRRASYSSNSAPQSRSDVLITAPPAATENGGSLSSRKISINRKPIRASTIHVTSASNSQPNVLSSTTLPITTGTGVDSPARNGGRHSHPSISPDAQKSRLQAEYDRLEAYSKSQEESAQQLAVEKQKLQDRLDALQTSHTELQRKANRYKMEWMELRALPLRENEDDAITAYNNLWANVRKNCEAVASAEDAFSRTVDVREWETLMKALGGGEGGKALHELLDPKIVLRDNAASFARAFMCNIFVVRIFPTGKSSHRDIIKDLWTHEATADSFAELEDDLRQSLSIERFNNWRCTTIRYLMSDSRNDRMRLSQLSDEISQTLLVIFGLTAMPSSPLETPSVARVRKFVRTLVLEAINVCKLMRRQKASFVVALQPPRVPSPGPKFEGKLLGKGSWKGRSKGKGEDGIKKNSVDFVVCPGLVRQTDEEGRREEERVCVEAEMCGVVFRGSGGKGGLGRRETY